MDVSFNKDKKTADSLDWVRIIVFCFVVVILLFAFVMRVVTVDGNSMNPTLNNQDKLVVSRLFYKPKYKDIVIVTQPNNLNKVLVKRIIATEGQTIEFDTEKGVVIVNGVELKEDYTLEPTYTAGHVKGKLVVPKGHVFVMGDNRNDSSDSRLNGIGCIDERYILGKAYFRIWPFGSGFSLK